MRPHVHVWFHLNSDENNNVDVIVKDEATDSGWEDIYSDVLVTKVETCEDRVKTEFINYKQEPSIGLKGNPLDWWNSSSAKFLLLSKLAKRYLCTQATSVASERIFCTAGDIVTSQRASLNPDNVEMLIFLKKNYKDSQCHLSSSLQLCCTMLYCAGTCTMVVFIKLRQ